MDKFNFFVPLEIEKASKDQSKDKYSNMIISGLASDNSQDTENEILEPGGYEIDYFLKHGLINLEHLTKRQSDPSAWIGEPISAEVKGNKFFIKAKLWAESPKARNFYDTMEIMAKSGSKRRPGFSIEGIPLERDPFNKKRIIKARITNCAVTMNPVNTNSYAEIVKGQQKADYIEPVFNEEETEGQETYLWKYDCGDETFFVDRDFKLKRVTKAVDLATIKPLIKESLEKKVFNINQWGTVMKSYKDGILTDIELGLIINKIESAL